MPGMPTNKDWKTAVCVTQDYIFDCNASNALPMLLEGLNCSCGENAEYQGIVYGYHLSKEFPYIKCWQTIQKKYQLSSQGFLCSKLTIHIIGKYITSNWF